jgi:rhamnose utilization protein RhaD (predicted bifunctional aldolase and dehydrogenase)
MDELDLTNKFISLSRYAGSRFDLLQAGGGNSSVKLDRRRMLVKASGYYLSEVESGRGYAVVDYPDVASLLRTPAEWQDDDKHRRDAKVSRLVEMSTRSSGVRASIEVFLHAVLGRFVLHSHPIAVNIVASQNDWARNFTALFSGALCVPYHTPGIQLGVELDAQVREFVSSHGHSPAIIFLQNHGLIVSAETAEEVQQITEDVVRRCGEQCNIDLGRYSLVTAIAEYVGDGSIAYLCEDRAITDLLETHTALFSLQPFCPDSFVFCGVVPLVVKNLSDKQSLEAYQMAYQGTPKVIIYDGQLYFVAKNIKKAKEIEEVYKAHLLALAAMKGEVNYLSSEELSYLGNWEAENYRKNK